ncbi:hypothetical protein B0T26DRAFT_470437 [Lasiosphaeria miniovina]|uniref:Transmembrane protein n=1 Tax=Lasiosphaeria miniovina TaxID=1954250 RepID=A0AA39ZZW4_9PEZI|nr:uncharacterized protein B0T26DRAFT_470437 [Lasiosphaeria miniovina]KAK0706748.1 hypothetical protein B0T26DRAFT_470437 [Lasiosphaeria miniovina]
MAWHFFCFRGRTTCISSEGSRFVQARSLHGIAWSGETVKEGTQEKRKARGVVLPVTLPPDTLFSFVFLVCFSSSESALDTEYGFSFYFSSYVSIGQPEQLKSLCPSTTLPAAFSSLSHKLDVLLLLPGALARCCSCCIYILFILLLGCPTSPYIIVCSYPFALAVCVALGVFGVQWLQILAM